MFDKISDLDLAKIFVFAKKEKIAKLINVDKLNTYNTYIIVYKFIVKNKEVFWDNIPNKYDLLFDEVFFAQVIDELKTAKNNGEELSGESLYREPHIMYVT